MYDNTHSCTRDVSLDLISPVHLQRAIAEQLSQEQPEDDDVASQQAHEGTHAKGIGHTVRSRVVDPVVSAVHALLAWIAHVWSHFVAFTVKIGSWVRHKLPGGKSA